MSKANRQLRRRQDLIEKQRDWALLVEKAQSQGIKLPRKRPASQEMRDNLLKGLI